jgi:DNA-binding beta-propeller fold protein YncE
LSPDGTQVAVSYFFGSAATIFNLSDFSIVQTWDTTGWASTVLFSPDGSSIAVPDYSANVVHVFVPGFGIPVAIPVGSQPSGGAFSPSDNRYIVVNAGAGTISDFDDDNIAFGTILSRPAGNSAAFAAFTPDGAQVWVPSLDENKIHIYNSLDWQEQTAIEIAGNPRQLWFTPDGCQAYVQLETGSAVVRYQLDPCFTPESSGGDGETDTSGTDGTEEVEKSLANTGGNADTNTGWTLFALAVLTAGAGALVVRRALRK